MVFERFQQFIAEAGSLRTELKRGLSRVNET